MLGVMRQFNPKWFYDYPNWLEYSVSSDATFNLMCYLFKDEDVHQHGGYIFFTRGFRSWNKKYRFGIHVGGPNSDHYKEILRTCAFETAKVIIKDLNGDYFSILVDKSCDVSCKGQMTLIFYYVDRRGFMMERFIGILYIRDTSALSLKGSIDSLLTQHSLSTSYIRGQCHDKPSNMQGQLTLVRICKKCDEVAGVVNLVSAMLNVVWASFKRRDELRDAQILKVQKALEVGELQSGRGLNQELGLARPSDIDWGSYFKSFVNFILLFASIIDDSLIDFVSAFCIKLDIEIPKFDSFNVFQGKSKRKVADCTVLHHYCLEVFYKVIDWQLKELNNRFNEVAFDLLHVKYSLLLPVATTIIERAFLAMKFIKTELRNMMEDDVLKDCLITYKKRDIFMCIFR
ncbi:hypothetical protein CDL12_03726 [Handroanthus impetiginosus]|uniref:TTF-type domain-containing protein n=1 Tax=Handroanthus impetiginosus TaxID=429701 RepID=A0A2G9I1C2_9LAMI|nr:hypothetical protein CDL12_03726 [Handroanthus impetiginosus]